MEYIDDRSCQVEKHAQIYNFSKLTLFELAWQLAIEFHARNRKIRFPKKFIEKGNYTSILPLWRPLLNVLTARPLAGVTGDKKKTQFMLATAHSKNKYTFWPG
jgi:hypothetical protein